MNYRKLNKAEIELLAINGCFADDWKNINITEKFSSELKLKNKHPEHIF